MEIIYAGGSHYGAGALRSIQKYFDRVYLIQENPESVLREKRACDRMIRDFDDTGCGVVFLGGYPKFITGQQLSVKTYINVHGALLPKYRGMHSTFWAIMNGEKELGITYHMVNPYMDAGDILAQYKFGYVGQSVFEINQSIDQLVEQHTGEVLSDYLLGRIVPVPQDDSAATYGARRNLSDCLVDFHWPNELLRRFFQALTPPYPLPMLKIRGELYEMLDHRLWIGIILGLWGGRCMWMEEGCGLRRRKGF